MSEGGGGLTPKQRELAEQGLRLVPIIAREMVPKLRKHFNLEALLSFGYEGLTEAARAFDAPLLHDKRAFPRFAKHRIRGAMLDAYAREVAEQERVSTLCRKAGLSFRERQRRQGDVHTDLDGKAEERLLDYTGGLTGSLFAAALGVIKAANPEEAILVSPYIHKGTVFRSEGKQPYDHTSLIATILKWLGLEKIADFGERTIGAPTFEGVLTLSEPRTDAREIPFLLSEEKKLGDPLRYYDRFCLQGKSGKKVSAAEYRGKIIPGDPVREYFPTMGDEGMMLHVENADDRPSTEMVPSGVGVKVITTDPKVGAYNVLGDWKDAVDCYYYNDYLTGEYDAQETWVIRRADGGSQIRFGDEVTLACRYKDQVLEENGTYLKVNSGSTANWKVLPPPRSA